MKGFGNVILVFLVVLAVFFLALNVFLLAVYKGVDTDSLIYLRTKFVINRIFNLVNNPIQNEDEIQRPIIRRQGLEDLVQYQVEKEVADKIKKVGFVPLYQLIDVDFEGRSVVYEDIYGFEGYQIVDINKVEETEDYIIKLRNIDNDVSSLEDSQTTFEVRFVGEGSMELVLGMEKSGVKINTFRGFENLSLGDEVVLTDLIRVNDVVRIELQERFEADDEISESKNLLSLIIIQRVW